MGRRRRGPGGAAVNSWRARPHRAGLPPPLGSPESPGSRRRRLPPVFQRAAKCRWQAAPCGWQLGNDTCLHPHPARGTAGLTLQPLTLLSKRFKAVSQAGIVGAALAPRAERMSHYLSSRETGGYQELNAVATCVARNCRGKNKTARSVFSAPSVIPLAR